MRMLTSFIALAALVCSSVAQYFMDGPYRPYHGPPPPGFGAGYGPTGFGHRPYRPHHHHSHHHHHRPGGFGGGGYPEGAYAPDQFGGPVTYPNGNAPSGASAPPPPPPPPPAAAAPAAPAPIPSAPAAPIAAAPAAWLIAKAPGSANAGGVGNGSVQNGQAVGTGTGVANAGPDGFGIGLGIGVAVATPLGNFVVGQGNSAAAGK